MINIYLLRHGETEQGSAKRCIGITDIPLSENGREQARCLRDYFVPTSLSGIFCSDALRAVDTAEIIADGRLPVTRLSDLHEIDMGTWEGMYFVEIKEKFPDEYKRRGLAFATFAPPGGESFSACQKRAFTVLHSILRDTEGDIAIVGHAGFNRTLICGLSGMGLSLGEVFSVPQPFGCVNQLVSENGVCYLLQAGFTVEQEKSITAQYALVGV